MTTVFFLRVAATAAIFALLSFICFALDLGGARAEDFWISLCVLFIVVLLLALVGSIWGAGS